MMKLKSTIKNIKLKTHNEFKRFDGMNVEGMSCNGMLGYDVMNWGVMRLIFSIFLFDP